MITNNIELERIRNNETNLTEKMNSALLESQRNVEQLSSDNALMKKYIVSLEKEVNAKTKELSTVEAALRLAE